MADPPKRCLYEVLGLQRDCTPAEIRSAYRRLALQLHPDKLSSSAGGGASSGAASTAAFQELQHAYEVLSDPKERAYYDSHRSQILFSDLSSKSNNSSSLFDLNLFSYFSSSVFSGFSDTGRGFYKVYGDLFTKIYSQELTFASRIGLSSDAVPTAPLIGNLDSPYAQVTAFYNYWLGFSTVMDFGWMDEYDSSLGPNRRSRRFMEEENKKVRKKAKKEYNDSVRGLAAFVKKRDKRVIDMTMKRKLEEERKKKEAMEKKKEEEKRKMERARAYEEPDWARVNQEEFIESESSFLGFEEIRDDESKNNKKKGGEELYCVVCSKKFKSDKQWKNHEQSKKHRDKVAELRLAMEEEEEALTELEGEINGEESNGEEINVGFDYEPAPESEEESEVVVNGLSENLNDDLDLRDDDDDDVAKEESDVGDQKLGSDHGDDDEESTLEAMILGRRSKKSERKEEEMGNSFSVLDDEGEEQEQPRRKGRRNRGVRREKIETKEERENGDCGDGMESTSCSTEEIGESSSKGGDGIGKNKKKGGSGKKDVDFGQKNPSKRDKQKAKKEAPSNFCDTCGESFESRNKLFAHLSDTGHAMLKSKQKSTTR